MPSYRSISRRWWLAALVTVTSVAAPLGQAVDFLVDRVGHERAIAELVRARLTGTPLTRDIRTSWRFYDSTAR